MDRQVSWTEAALSDLEAAADYVAIDSPRYAASLVDEALRAAASLNRLSLRGHVVPEYEDEAVRELFVRKFRLVYHVRDDVVFIIGFIHGARDLGMALGERGV